MTLAYLLEPKFDGLVRLPSISWPKLKEDGIPVTITNRSAGKVAEYHPCSSSARREFKLVPYKSRQFFKSVEVDTSTPLVPV